MARHAGPGQPRWPQAPHNSAGCSCSPQQSAASASVNATAFAMVLPACTFLHAALASARLSRWQPPVCSSDPAPPKLPTVSIAAGKSGVSERAHWRRSKLTTTVVARQPPAGEAPGGFWRRQRGVCDAYNKKQPLTNRRRAGQKQRRVLEPSAAGQSRARQVKACRERAGNWQPPVGSICNVG